MLIFCLVVPHPKKEKIGFKNIILLSRNWNKDRANKMTVQKFIFATRYGENIFHVEIYEHYCSRKIE